MKHLISTVFAIYGLYKTKGVSDEYQEADFALPRSIRNTPSCESEAGRRCVLSTADHHLLHAVAISWVRQVRQHAVVASGGYVDLYRLTNTGI